MKFHAENAFTSYAKTAVACLLVFLFAVLAAVIAANMAPNILKLVLVMLGIVVALGAATLFGASTIVLVRYRRAISGEQDLFLRLNRSREPDAIMNTRRRHVSQARRWIARQILGHDLVAGDLVEIKSWDEIRSTLDESGCYEQLPFMPEMLAMCGRRARVFRAMHRLFDYRKTRQMRHMTGTVLLTATECNGSDHGGCTARCHIVWKSAWLRRLSHVNDGTETQPDISGSYQDRTAGLMRNGTQGPRYTCQLTELNAASRPIGGWSLANFFRPLVSGNVTPAAFLIGRLTNLFNEFQHQRRGVSFPAFGILAPDHDEGVDSLDLAPGDQVTVRSSAEIRATLNDRLIHKGMGFEIDMLKYCGQPATVQTEVTSLVDIVTGELHTMKTPAYILRDVHFSGERQQFNSQYEPLFWRSVWLKKY